MVKLMMRITIKTRYFLENANIYYVILSWYQAKKELSKMKMDFPLMHHSSMLSSRIELDCGLLYVAQINAVSQAALHMSRSRQHVLFTQRKYSFIFRVMINVRMQRYFLQLHRSITLWDRIIYDYCSHIYDVIKTIISAPFQFLINYIY